MTIHTSSCDSITGKIARLPWFLLFLISFTATIGFSLMYSAAQGHFQPWAFRQVVHFSVFLPVMLVIALVDIKLLFRYAYVPYVMVLLLLVVVEISGHTAMGATRWVNLGSFKLQPSELMKISLVFALARYFHSISLEEIGKPLVLVPPLFMVLVPFALIMKQPDLGTATILLLVGGAMFFMAGVRLWKFALVIGAGLSALPVLWHFMHDYQRQRVITFLHPEKDPLGAGYNILQSKIAIGSGGFAGKGLLHGSQSQLNFLPEHQTDFIFTMLAEELGFAGGSLILLLYTLIIGYGILIALTSRNQFGRLLAIGAITIFFVHVFVNMGMVMGMLPVVGAPLPLLSYGGTIMMTILIGFGVLINVHIHKDTVIKRGGVL